MNIEAIAWLIIILLFIGITVYTIYAIQIHLLYNRVNVVNSLVIASLFSFTFILMIFLYYRLKSHRE